MAKLDKETISDSFLDEDENSLDLRNLAIFCIKSFFVGKKKESGESIPVKELLSDLSVKTVLRTPFDDDTFLFIHENCLSQIPKPADYETPISWPVFYLLGLLSEMRKLGLPKDFQPGLVLLYFKFCKEMRVISPDTI
jgi:hypothetical protein